jgi:LysM repeat protein
MKKIVSKSLFLLPLFFVGCASLTSSPKEEKHQMELSLHKVRTDVEDIKHDLNTYEIEHHVLEGKLIDQEQTITSLKQQVAELKQGKLESFTQEIQALEKNLTQLAKKQEKIISDIRQLSSHANETTTALTQYKEKIAQFEKVVLTQNEQIKELVKVQQGLASLGQMKIYTVKGGDSLEKIAREKGLSVEELKKKNNLSSDLIVIGQELLLP